MASASTYLGGKLIDAILRQEAFPAIPAIFLALFTSDPTDLNAGTEVTGEAYARVDVTGKFSAPERVADMDQTYNTELIEFPEATGPWGTVTHWGLYDAATGGNLLLHGSWSFPMETGVNNQISFKPGKLCISVD